MSERNIIFAWTNNNNNNKVHDVNRRPRSTVGSSATEQRSPSTTLTCSPVNIDPTTTTTTRREMILASAVVITTTIIGSVSSPQSAMAAAPLDAGEAIRRGASNLPGYGSSDVFYPESFAGSWKMTRDVEFPSSLSSSSSPPSSPPPVLRLTYPVRFIRSIEDDAVVADRGFNQAELEAALVRRRTSTASTSSSTTASTTATSSAVLSYEWTQNNPNVLRVVLSDGTKKEIKVTKRATERTEDTVSSSEFQRVTQETTTPTPTLQLQQQQQTGGGPPGGIPVISARRVVSKWKKVNDSTLEGIEIVYAVGGGGDPLSITSLVSNNNAAPTILSKSRLYLVR